MPQYEYVCPKCLQRQSLIRPVGDRDNEVLCECNTKCTRLVSKCTFQLKGSGWSKDGFASYYGDLPEVKNDNKR